MNELTLETLFRAKYAGSIGEMSSYVSLAVQTVAVMIGGIVLWRASVVLHKKKKSQRSRNAYFDTPYSKGWKRK